MHAAPKAASVWRSDFFAIVIAALRQGSQLRELAVAAMAMQRLQTRSQFQATLAGKIAAKTPHFALHRCALAAADATNVATVPLFPVTAVWLGAMVPKRWAKRAVTRNAIKRQIYSVGDLYQTQMPQQAHLVRLRAAFPRSEFKSATSIALKSAVRHELLQLFAAAGIAVVPHSQGG